MYKLIIHVETADDMAIIIQACKGTAVLKLAEEVEEKSPQRRRATTPLPRPQMTGEALMRTIFADGKSHSTGEIKAIFTKNGFQTNSVSPVLSRLKNNSKELRQTAVPGEYEPTPRFKSNANGAV